MPVPAKPSSEQRKLYTQWMQDRADIREQKGTAHRLRVIFEAGCPAYFGLFNRRQHVHYYDPGQRRRRPALSPVPPHKDVSFSKVIKALIKPRTFVLGSRDMVLINIPLVDPDSQECVMLQICCLAIISHTDTAVAYKHNGILHEKRCLTMFS